MVSLFNYESLIQFLALVLIAVCVCAYFRLQFRKREIKELHSYMKNLVDQVNSSPTSRWKAKFNPFGSKKKDYNYKTLKNLTAVKEYVGYLEEFFRSEKMQHHLAYVSVEKYKICLANSTHTRQISCRDILMHVKNGQCVRPCIMCRIKVDVDHVM